MSYEIIIKETRTVTRKVGKEWTVIGTQEVPREDRYYKSDPQEPKTRIDEVRGYTPEVEREVTETVEILKQVVEELDLPDVIRAINGLQ